MACETSCLRMLGVRGANATFVLSSSVGIYTDGQMLVGSHWFQPLTRLCFDPGCTVGMLVYVGSSSSAAAAAAAVMAPDRSGCGPADTSRSDGEVIDHAESSATEDRGRQTQKQSNTVVFNLNGRTVLYENQTEEQMKIAIPSDAPLYPTVSLFSANTRLVSKGNVSAANRSQD